MANRWKLRRCPWLEVVELQHGEGWTVRVRMSKSALVRRDDPVALVTFGNVTERLWMDEWCVPWD